MKNKFLLLIAASALLASCGGSTAADAPAVKEEARFADVQNAAQKALTAASNAKGFLAEFGAEADFKAVASVPGANLGMEEKTVDLTEKLSLKNFSLKEGATVKDGKLVASGSLSGNLNAEIMLPKMPEEQKEDAKVTIETKKIDTGFSAKDYLSDDVVYLDGSGLYDAYGKVMEVVKSFAPISDPIASANDLKVAKKLEAGTCADVGSGWKELVASYGTMVLGYIAELGNQEDLTVNKYVDGSYGFTINLIDFLKDKAEPGFDLSGLTGELTITVSETCTIHAYAKIGGSTEIEDNSGLKSKIEVSAKASFGLQLNDNVVVETVTNPESYRVIA